MDSELYEVCRNKGNVSWSELARKYGYSCGESLRSSYRRFNPNKQEKITKNRNLPRIGVADIETLPAEVYVFSLYDQNVSLSQIKHDVSILSWAGKYLNEPEMYSDIMTPEESVERKEERVVKSAWKFLSNCDAVIGHNWTNFDGKILNGLFLAYGLPPLHYITIDTLAIARANFKFQSNKLEFLNKKLGIRNKIHNDGFPLWKSCCEGDKQALDTMLRYNEADVTASEDLFYKIRPYIKNFNVSLFNEIDGFQCPTCGSANLKSEGFYYSKTSKYETLRCKDCQSLSRKKENLLTKDKKKNILINI